LFYWRGIFGSSELALRSLSACLGVGSVIAVYLTALRIYSRKHALWSSLIISFSSFCVYYSQETRAYALLIFFAALQLYCFSQVLKPEKPHWLTVLTFALVTVVSLLGSIFMGLFTLALCLSHLLVNRQLREWLRWWLPTAVFSLPVSIFYLASPAAADPSATAVTRTGIPIVQNALFVLYGILVGTTYGPPLTELRGEERLKVMFGYWPHLLLLALVVAVIVLALASRLLKTYKSKRLQQYQQADYLFAYLLFFSFVLGLIFALVTKMNWLPRHSFYLYLPLAILVPSALTRRAKKRSQSFDRESIVRGAIALLIVLNIYSLSHYYFDESHEKDDYRAAAQYLVNSRDSNTESLMLRGNTRLLQYYGDNQTLHAWQYLKKLKQKNFAQQIEQLTNQAQTVAIAINREEKISQNMANLLEDSLKDLYVLNAQKDFSYIKIYNFTKKQA
jgi:4-amino-4-deoxy-L-arabinose transferase-like glycosyltransferase